MPIKGKHLIIIPFIIIIIISEWLKVPSSHGHPELGLNLSLAASLLGDLESPSLPRACLPLCIRVGKQQGRCTLHTQQYLCNYHPGSCSLFLCKVPWEATCSRGQSSCLVTSVTQGSPGPGPRWVQVEQEGRWLLWLRPRGALRSRSYSQPHSPSVPFLPQVGVHGDGTEKGNSSQDGPQDWRQEPTSCHSLPVLIWLCPRHWTPGRATGAGSS